MILFSSVFPILLAVLPVYYLKVCVSHELDATCGTYTYKINKATHKYFSPISKIIKVKDENIVSLNIICRSNLKRILELNNKLKEKDTITETESLKNKISAQNTLIQNLQSDIISCQNIVTNKDIAFSKLKMKFDEFNDKKKYIHNGCNINSSLVHVMKLGVLPPFLVSCDSAVAGPGWTVIQRRINGIVDFYRNWEEYKNGFGEFHNEFFLSLDNLHAITSSKRYELFIKLVDQKNETRFARYDNFLIGCESEYYKLKSVGKYTGNAGDSMRHHVGHYFSTYDKNNDVHNCNCAETVKGAWWYFNCGDSNLNGKRFDCNLEDSNALESTGCIYWQTWHGRSYSLRYVQMMIRPYDYSSITN